MFSLFQAYEDDSDEKRSANMNMGPRTWYQVPRDLRYPPEVNKYSVVTLHFRSQTNHF